MKNVTAKFTTINTRTTAGLGVVKTNRRSGNAKMDVLVLVNKEAAKKAAIGVTVAGLVVGGIYAATQI